MKKLSVVTGNIWYHLTWLMMLDINMCVTFLPVQNKYPATRFICQDFDKKMNIDDRKVQVANDIMAEIWKYLVSSDVADDACYNYVCYISSCAK